MIAAPEPIARRIIHHRRPTCHARSTDGKPTVGVLASVVSPGNRPDRLSNPARDSSPSSTASRADLVPTVLRGDAVPDAPRPRNDDPRGGRRGASQTAFPRRVWEQVKNHSRCYYERTSGHRDHAREGVGSDGRSPQPRTSVRSAHGGIGLTTEAGGCAGLNHRLTPVVRPRGGPRCFRWVLKDLPSWSLPGPGADAPGLRSSAAARLGNATRNGTPWRPGRRLPWAMRMQAAPNRVDPRRHRNVRMAGSSSRTWPDGIPTWPRS